MLSTTGLQLSCKNETKMKSIGQKFSFDIFSQKLSKNKFIKKFTLQPDNIIEIEYQDGLKLFIDVCEEIDAYHKFYTYLTDHKSDRKLCYIYKMPHDSFKELYFEINRMNNDTTRKVESMYNYEKGFF